jgi:uncharacterized membrane protein
LFARYAVLASFGLLLLILAASLSWSALPLLIFAWGIWRQDWRTHIWLCFVLLFYFLVVINQLAQNPAAWSSWLECGLIVILFTGAMLYCRWVKRVNIFEEGKL